MCKKVMYFVSFVLVLSITGNASSELVGYWKFDEGSGAVTKDSSGNGHDGSFEGSPKWMSPGWNGVGWCLQFGGDSDRVTIEPFDLTGSGITLAAWIYPTAFQDDARLISKSEGSGTPDHYWAMILSGSGENNLEFRLRTDTGATSRYSAPDTHDLQTDEWTHIALTWDAGDPFMRFYKNGEEIFSQSKAGGAVGTNPSVKMAIGNQSASVADASGRIRPFGGLIDDVVVYDRALDKEELEAVMSGLQGIPYARKPDPADGSMLTSTWVNMAWVPGQWAVSHDVYIGTNLNDVNDGAEGTFVGNTASDFMVVGFPGFAYPDGLAPGTTYYWRIDEVNDTDPNSPWKGDVWSFWVPPKTAYNPIPPDGVEFVALDVNLSWTAGFGAKLHHVYFGDNFDDVNSAVVGIPHATTTYTPGPLVKDAVYYWRLDEFDGVATHKGDIWSFSTLPVIPIVDSHLKGWWKLDEGYGTIAVDWSGHDNHGSLNGTDMSWMPDDGMIGGALSFDGTASDTDYVEISTADISFTAGTVAMWGKLQPGPQSPDTRYFFGHTTIPAWNDRIQLYMDNADTILDLGLGDSHARQTDIISLSAETWYHVALTWDGGNYVVYVNGQEKANGSYTGLETLNTIADIGNDGNLGNEVEAFNGLLDNVRIYNKVLTQEEIQLAMRGNPLLAWGPNPTPGSTPYIRDVTPLSWSPGDNASQHDVYFGTDKNAVSDADESDTTGIYRGRQGVTFYTPAEGVEWGGGPYYWRVDEYNTDATISKGNVWSFTVADFIVIDDFEDYNDYPPDEIFSTWLDGYGTTTNGSTAGYAEPDWNAGEHYIETTIVHGGSQSMPLFYENNFKYSEAAMTLVSTRNWTEEDVGVLSLWFRGDASNAAERMYVALNGSAVAYHDNPNAAQIEAWTEWRIDLQEFAAQGVNLANVNTIAIGFGDKNNLQAGGSGVVYFDDIRLYRPAQ